MLVVIEGTDGTGKSTLASALGRALIDTRHRKIDVRHFGPPEDHPLAEYERWLDDYVPGTGHHIVADRFHWGEMIYPELYRNGSRLGDHGYWHIEQYLRSRGALMIHATGDVKEIAARQLALNEDFLQPVDATKVWEMFQTLAKNSFQDVLTYDSTLHPVEWMVKQALSTGQHHESIAAQTTADYPSYIGGHAPKLLLVGDTPMEESNVSRQHEAAFPPYGASSGRYLIDTLIQYAPDCGRDVGIVNAYHRNSIGINLLGLWTRLGEPDTVALGASADHHLSVCGVPHQRADHPQYRRRFFHNSMADYGRDIRGQ